MKQTISKSILTNSGTSPAVEDLDAVIKAVNLSWLKGEAFFSE